VTESTTDVETVRVAQIWPKSIKERVRRLSGARGVTTWTLEAVEQRLAREEGDAPPAVTPAPVTTPAPATPTPAVDPLQNEGIAALADKAGLRRASELAPPPAQPEPEPVEPEVVTSDPTDLCPKCNEPRVNGECWNCW